MKGHLVLFSIPVVGKSFWTRDSRRFDKERLRRSEEGVGQDREAGLAVGGDFPHQTQPKRKNKTSE